MKAKYLYINGEYVHTNKELSNKVQKLIDDKNTSRDATIRLLSDLYRNGHLREFCSQKEYSNRNEDISDIVTFEENLKGDIKIANHVAARLKGDDNYAPFSQGIHKHFTIHSVSISRKEEQEVPIWSIPFALEEKNESVSVFLLNGFRQHKNSIKDAFVNLTYSIDNKESLNEQIPVSIGSHSEILNLSKIKEEMEVSIKIKESNLDPCKDIDILIGDDGCYGKIILKAPQVAVNICHKESVIPYHMMRIIKENKRFFYIGVWPFEYNNMSYWLKGIKTEYPLFSRYYSKRNINFYVLPNNDSDDYYGFFREFKLQENSLKNLPAYGNWVLDIPQIKEWEYVSLINETGDKRGDIVCQKSLDEMRSLSSNELRDIKPNQYGVYAMLGNIHEIALDSLTPCFMGGNLRVRGNMVENDLSTRKLNHDDVPFYCLRLVIHHREKVTIDFDDDNNDKFIDNDPIIDEYSYRLRNWG